MYNWPQTADICKKSLYVAKEQSFYFHDTVNFHHKSTKTAVQLTVKKHMIVWLIDLIENCFAVYKSCATCSLQFSSQVSHRAQ